MIFFKHKNTEKVIASALLQIPETVDQHFRENESPVTLPLVTPEINRTDGRDETTAASSKSLFLAMQGKCWSCAILPNPITPILIVTC